MARDTLTREQIVRAAIDLLDADGTDGLSMRRLGERLGSAATAVYWHVESKDNLVQLAADQVWNDVDLPDLDKVGWRTAATTMATGMHAMLTRHPWLVQVFGSHPLYGPGKARFDDHGLAIFELAGFSGPDADRAYATVFSFVLGCALPAAVEALLTKRLSRDGRDPERVLADTMAKATEIGSGFPRLRQRAQDAAEIGYADAPAQTFQYGLAAILDGLEARLTGHSS